MCEKNKINILQTFCIQIENMGDVYCNRKQKERRNETMNRNDKEYLVQKIRTRYTEKEHSQLDELRALDRKVTRPPTVFSYVFGSLGAIVMGAGMSLVMTDLGTMLSPADPMPIGIAVGLVGLAIVSANYPLYRSLLEGRRAKYAKEVIALSEKIVNSERE